MKKTIFYLFFLVSIGGLAQRPTKVQYQSLDSLQVTANLYHINDEKPIILLFHQAGFSKFEYEGIAQELNTIGFNCLAVDLRSGGPIANQVNETNVEARQNEKAVGFLDASQDIEASFNYAITKYKKGVILWGSSFTSTLVLYLAVEKDQVIGVVSFSPGNYFAEQKGSLVDKLSGYEKPIFLTSSKREAPDLTKLVKEIGLASSRQIQFVPEGNGHHGSRALWDSQTDNKEYWNAIKPWLKKF